MQSHHCSCRGNARTNCWGAEAWHSLPLHPLYVLWKLSHDWEISCLIATAKGTNFNSKLITFSNPENLVYLNNLKHKITDLSPVSGPSLFFQDQIFNTGWIQVFHHARYFWVYSKSSLAEATTPYIHSIVGSSQGNGEGKIRWPDGTWLSDDYSWWWWWWCVLRLSLNVWLWKLLHILFIVFGNMLMFKYIIE